MTHIIVKVVGMPELIEKPSNLYKKSGYEPLCFNRVSIGACI